MGGQILEYEAKNILNQGINQGARILSDIIKRLTAENRQDEIERVLSDEKIRNEYINKYNSNQ